MVGGWSRKACVKSIQACADELGKSPTLDDYERWRSTRHPADNAIYNQFGSWNAAKEAAGLTTEPENGAD